MERDRFVIEASEAESMAKELGLSVLQLLPSLVKPAQKLARPPISKYHVGAVGLGSDGRIFFGSNLEFPGLPLHHSVHAEQFLITNAAINGESQLLYLAVSSAPCGHCRQFMQEMRGANEMKILITSTEMGDDQNQDLLVFRPLSHFLTHPFGPDDLLGNDVPLLLEPHNNGLTFDDPNQIKNSNNVGIDLKLHSNGIIHTHDQDEQLFSVLKIAALEAANKSHAPYSGCPSGVALMDSDGKIYKGSYTESAAYNPSLGPVQAALVAYVASGGGGGYDKIVAGVLVEKDGVMVRQESSAKLILQAVAPKCDFQVFYCNSSKKNV